MRFCLYSRSYSMCVHLKHCTGPHRLRHYTIICAMHSCLTPFHGWLWVPCRPWSAGGFTGRPELNTFVSDGQLLPGTVAWHSPRNHIGVHPESLLFNRDPEQLAEDVIGLSEKYASLANEHVSFCPALPCPTLPCPALPCPESLT